MVHEAHHFVGVVLESGGGEQRSNVKRHVRLGGVEHEQLWPTPLQQIHLEICIKLYVISKKAYLISNLQFGKEWNPACPLDGAKEQPRRQLADGFDAHQSGSGRISRIRLGAQQETDKARQVARSRRAQEAVRSGQGELTHVLTRWHAAALNCCTRKTIFIIDNKK